MEDPLDERTHRKAPVLSTVVAAIDVIDSLPDSSFPGEARTVALGEWGLTVPAGEQAAGWPLDVGLRPRRRPADREGARALLPEGVDPWGLLWWNRQTRFIRFGWTPEREV